MPVLDHISGIASEEQRLGRARACNSGLVPDSGRDILPQREHTLLLKVPTLPIEGDVQLKGRGFVPAEETDCGAGIVDSGVCEGRSVLRS
jgi:hypothetical protein